MEKLYIILLVLFVITFESCKNSVLNNNDTDKVEEINFVIDYRLRLSDYANSKSKIRTEGFVPTPEVAYSIANAVLSVTSPQKIEQCKIEKRAQKSINFNKILSYEKEQIY